MRLRMTAWLLCISVFFSLGFFGRIVTAKNSDLVMPSGIILLGQSSYKLAEGVVETNLVTNISSGKEQVRSFAAAITLSDDVKILANYGSYYNKNSSKWGISSWKVSKTTSQAEKYETATGEKVIVAINGDFYNMSSGKPKGALVINGKTYHDASNRPYFAILKNGTAVIRDAGSEITDNVTQAVGGSTLLVKNGVVKVSSAEKKRTPCTSIGIRSDGTVIMYEVDGRDDDISEGYTLYDHARMLVTLGCVTALCLDGGGSSTFAARHGASGPLELQNVPSDGKERSVSSTLMVVASPLSTVTETVYTINTQTTAKATATPKAKATATPKAKATSTPKPSKVSSSGSNNSSSIKTFGTGSNVKYDGSTGSDNDSDNSITSLRLFKKDGKYYRIISKKKKTAAFAGVVNKKKKKIVIPAKVRKDGVTYKVTSIDEGACSNCYKLKFLYLGKNITKVGKRAFYNCIELKKVHGLSRLSGKKKMTFGKFYFRYVLDI